MIGGNIIRHKLLSIYISILLITTSFLGILALVDVTDNGQFEAAGIIVDSGGGGDYTTIQAAVDAAAYGDTIFVKAGTYNENVVISTTLSIIGDGMGNTTINGGGTWSVDTVRITADYVNITGFTVTGGGGSFEDAGIALIWTDYCRVYGNNVSGNSELGIFVDVSRYNRIENNTVTSNVGTAIYLTNNYNTISNNTISDNKNGIYLNSAFNNEILNNTIDNSVEMDIKISISSSVTLANNTMTGGGVYIWGDFIQYWNTHDIDTSNTVNGKPVHYWKDKVGGSVPSNAGQVILANCRFVNITNLDISNVHSAIDLGYSSAANVSASTISDTKSYGISLYKSSWNTIDDIKINRGAIYGFNLRDSHRNSFVNCNVSNSFNYVAYLYNSDHTEFINNSIWRSYGSGLSFSNSDYGVIENNFIHLMNYTAVRLSESNNFIVSNNTLTKNNASGIYLYSADDNIIAGNTATDNKVDGIHLEGSNYNTIDDNDVSRNLENGITLRWITAGPESDYNTISNNTADYCKNGIYMGSVNNNIVELNTVSYNTEFGFYMTGADSSTIRFNTFSYNSNSGIYTRQSSGDRIYENTVSYNYKGIELGFMSTGHFIYHNNIISNFIQNVHDSNNYWYYNMEGNYWSDYTGEDNGAGGRTEGDGIGDTWLPHNNDNYPFMSSFGWDRPAPPILSGPVDLVTESTFVLGWTSGPRTNGFVMERDTSPLFFNADELYNSTGKSMIMNNHENGTFYFRVKAYNDEFESPWSNTLTVTVDWAPSKPTGLTAKEIDGRKVTLSWNLNPEHDIAGYHVMVNNSDTGSADPYIIIQSVNETTSEVTFENLAEKITYEFALVAFDMVPTDSKLSDILTITITDMAPKPPVDLEIKTVWTNSITLTWSANTESDLGGYNLYRSVTETGTFTRVNTDKLAVLEYMDIGLKEATTYFYKLTAVDIENHESTFSEIVNGTTILKEYPPEVANPIDDFSIPEDSRDDSTINLMVTFNDVNDDSMFFRSEGQKNIKVSIFQDDGSVTIEPVENWCGSETLTFYAKDSTGEASESVTITVLPVNDAPTSTSIISPEDRDRFKSNETINFEGICVDVDLPYGDIHTYTWTSNISGKIGAGQIIKNIKLPVGTHLITLEVTDQDQLSVSSTLEVTVIKAVQQIDPIDLDTEDDGTEDESGLGTIYIDLALIVIVLIIAFIALIFVRRRRKSDDDIEDVPEDDLEGEGEGEEIEAEPQVEQLAPPLPLSSPEQPQPVVQKPSAQPQPLQGSEPQAVVPGQIPEHVQERVQEQVHAEVQQAVVQHQVAPPPEQVAVQRFPIQPVQPQQSQPAVLPPYGQALPPPQQLQFQQEPAELPPCPSCEANMVFVPEFYKYYCVECNKYINVE